MTDTHRETALDALLQTVVKRLKDDSRPWGQKVATGVPGTAWGDPFVQVTHSGGNEVNQVRTPDAEIILDIKGVSEDKGEAFDCAAHIDTLINDEGTQDAGGSASRLDGGDTWEITTATKEHFISYQESFAKTAPTFHEGARYRFTLSAT